MRFQPEPEPVPLRSRSQTSNLVKPIESNRRAIYRCHVRITQNGTDRLVAEVPDAAHELGLAAGRRPHGAPRRQERRARRRRRHQLAAARACRQTNDTSEPARFRFRAIKYLAPLFTRRTGRPLPRHP